MKNLGLKNQLKTIFLTMSIVLLPAALPAQATTATTTDECSKELLLSYFPEAFVSQTLKKYNVPQDKWDSISKGLAAKDKDVLKIVEEKASKLTPNPFKDRDPAQRQVAVKIFRETLTQVFSEVLKANGITDDNQIAMMLDDIQQQKAKNFAQCMEKQKQSFQQQSQTTPSQVPSAAPSTETEKTESDSSPQLADNEDSDKNPSTDGGSDDSDENKDSD